MDSIKSLVKELHKHPAINNTFYDAWMNRQFNIDELEIFAENYAAWVKSFPNTLALLFLSTEDPEAKIEYVKTLYSEMGNGNLAQVHWKLLDKFFSELSEKMGAKMKEKTLLLGTTKELISGEQKLYENEDRRIAVGAQLALEWQAYTMLRKLYEGARNYMDLWDNQDEFHEACEYFYDHIGAVEKEHKVESLKAAERYVTDTESLEKIKVGFEKHLQLISNFWEGIYKKLEQKE